MKRNIINLRQERLGQYDYKVYKNQSHNRYYISRLDSVYLSRVTIDRKEADVFKAMPNYQLFAEIDKRILVERHKGSPDFYFSRVA